MKLELKHLTPYLPYGLEWFCLDQDSRECEELPTVKMFNLPNETLEIGGMDIDISELPYPNGLTIKPILRPLSDLYEKVRYFENTYPSFDVTQIDSLINDSRWLNQCEYLLVQYLFEWYFDVFGLIEKGLAIDINTLNP